jgi:ZIP family zinc transporter
MLPCASSCFLPIAIGIQDVPEGFAVSASLILIKRNKLRAVLVDVFSDLIEMTMCVTGALLYCQSLPGIGIGFAIEALMYVVIEELLQEVLHEKAGNRKLASLDFILGLYTILYLEALIV